MSIGPSAADDLVHSVLASNPFLNSLGEHIDFCDISTHLASSPLEGIARESISTSNREDLLSLRKQHFVPTTDAQNIVAALQSLHREHYIHRNPSIANVRKKIIQIAQHRDKDISDLPWFPDNASGIILMGITGTGKSMIIDRYLSLLPHQVVFYGDGEIPGLAVIKQIVWLKVDMSADGSRGGLLMSILSQVDKALGTDYHDQYSRTRITIERLMVRVGIILSTHFTGMLVIEEIQPENFSNSQWMKEISSFFLRLLNFGIPIVLVGNPLGFDSLLLQTQVMRRLTTGGVFRLHPTSNGSDFDWDMLLLPCVWSFNVMPKPTVLSDEIKKILFKYSGGINDFLVRLCVDSQRIALRRGGLFVTPEDIVVAYNGPTFKDNHNLIRGFADKNLNRLSLCKDIPIEYYANLWKNLAPVNLELPIERTEVAAPTMSKPSSDSKLSHFKSDQTRKKNREKKVQELNVSLSDDDMRRGGAKASLITGLNELKKKLENK